MGVHVTHGELRVVGVGVLVVCMLISLSQQSDPSDQDVDSSASAVQQHQPQDRPRRTVGHANPLQQLVDALQGEGDMNNADMYLHYTPTTPAPHLINCYVEVPTTLRKGGRCIQLGGFRGRRSRNRPWACQAGIHLAFSADCNPRRMGRSGRRG